MSFRKVLIVLPTYNESENIESLIKTLTGKSVDFDVCVVDDSSADGTGKIVTRLINEIPGRVHLIERSKKNGRGGAVRAGFEFGIKSPLNYNIFIEMDSDFSHPPDSILLGLSILAKGNDVVLGSRYPNGTIIGWPLGRRIFSRLSNYLARILIAPAISDYTNGFRFYTRETVTFLINQKQKNFGYIYLSEMLSSLVLNHYRIASFPIVFRNRERGKSNMNLKEVYNAFIGIMGVAWNHHKSR